MNNKIIYSIDSDNPCQVEHTSFFSTNLDGGLGFGMDQLSRRIRFAGLSVEFHVSFALKSRRCIPFGRRMPYYLLGKQ